MNKDDDSIRGSVFAFTVVLALAGCGPAGETESEPVAQTSEGLNAYCTANVLGHGKLDVEKNYLPHVVQATAGQVLRHGGVTLCSFFVAGDSSLKAPGCVGQDADAATEKFVTYN